MRNVEQWTPSKLVYDTRRGRYVPHPKGVSLGSRLAVSAMAEPYARMFGEHARGRLLDCGCGKVPFFGMYRDRVSEVTCIDWNDAGHADHIVDLNGKLPFADARFDTVLLSDVLEHVPEPARLLGELARVLAPGGKLLVTVPFLYHVHEAPHDYYRYTRFALEGLCEAAQLSVLELAPYGGFPDVLLDLVNKGLKSVPPLCKLFVHGVGWVMRTGPYRAYRKQTEERFPLGYCLVAQRG